MKFHVVKKVVPAYQHKKYSTKAKILAKGLTRKDTPQMMPQFVQEVLKKLLPKNEVPLDLIPSSKLMFVDN